MVFGSYAPYPHENVYDNIACGARMRKSPQQEIDARARRSRRLESSICWTGGPGSWDSPGETDEHGDPKKRLFAELFDQASGVNLKAQNI
jgi:hypothetical protein